MRTIYIAIVFFVITLSAKAQSNDTIMNLRGRVYDYITHVELPGSRVEVLSAADSIVIDSTTARIEWEMGTDRYVTSDYSLHIPRKEGNYLLRFTNDGYDPMYMVLNLHKIYRRELSREMEPAYLRRTKIIQMNEVTVTATRIKFYHRGDTLVYNADAFQLSEGSMLDALVRQLPGAELHKDGRIYVNGKFVESLLLNGKDFFKGNNQIMLDNLPTYMVSQIQVYDKLGDRSNFLGREVAGDKRYVMDVKLKKQYSIGWTGNFEAGGGTHDRYMGRLFALRFTDHSRLAAYGNANNLNDSRKPGEDDSWSPSDLKGGLSKQQTGGLDYSLDARSGKYKVESNLQLSHADNTTINHTSRINFLSGGDTYDRMVAATHSHALSLTTSQRVYFQFKNFDLDIRPGFNYRKYDNRDSYGAITSSQSFSGYDRAQLDSLYAPSQRASFLKSVINRNLQEGRTKGHSLETSISVTSVIKLKHSSDNITFDASATYHDASEDRFDRNRVDYFSDGQITSTDFRNRYFDNRPERSYSYMGKATYTYVIKRDLSLDMAYKFTHSNTSRGSALYRLDKLDGWGTDAAYPLGSLPSVDAYERVMDAANSYNSHQQDNCQTVELNLVWNKTTAKSKWWAQFFMPVSLLSRTLHYRRGDVDTTFTRHTALLNLYSTVIQWRSTDRKYRAEFQYGIDSKAPDMSNYVNIHDTTDPLNITLGNPKLKTSYTHSFTINFDRSYPHEGRMWAIMTAFKPTRNALAMGYAYDKTTGQRTYRPDNVNGNWTGDIAAGFRSPLNKKKTLNFNVITAISYNHSVDLVSVGNSFGTNRSIVHTMSNQECIKISYETAPVSVVFKTEGTWTHATGTRDDFKTIDATDFNYGITARLQLPWQFQLGTDITMYSRRGYNDKAMNTDDLVWNARLSRPFFHGKFIALVDGFDMLGQLSGVTRTLNAQALTEVYSNVIPRYVMFHVIYKFHTTPKKK